MRHRDKTDPRNGMRAKALNYMMSNGRRADKFEIAKLLGIGTSEVATMMRGSWGRDIISCSGTAGRTEYTINDEEEAKKFIESYSPRGDANGQSADA